jgi:hypothetical protein
MGGEEVVEGQDRGISVKGALWQSVAILGRIRASVWRVRDEN